ncbi:MAG: phosphohistidine phosphatase SixA [Blastocatellia bacterium]|nr:phosphohistidine phosphatase SixA [Blastocatellia bacterium]MCS7158258.1 phosphohistidine phosphatase SixA [Blastocatellia bacterium]MCX7753096.1 phosphohistidine phosphatase SixA [Blastocatellia bacterium]MDW8169411.1 phosphohistidine phosphatase SixA [Acidobacteriota bacterium]MDW8256479.1 phosphohistidine phosphatase SixA [Acidobacteriota bacterium]
MGMYLYLVQHAEAKREEEDPARPLTERGWADIRKIAAFLEARSLPPLRVIYHSGKTRAAQTAEVLAGALKPSDGCQATDGLDPLADPTIWLERVNAASEDLMLVGHLPHLDRLSARLLSGGTIGEGLVAFRMGGIVCLQREGTTWRVRWMIVPELL